MAPKTLTKKEACAVLGIAYPTTKRDAKVAFMNLVRENHEDKGGDKEKNQIINEAYENLIDKPTGDQAANGNSTDGIDSDESDGENGIDDIENDSDSDYEDEEGRTDAEDDSTSLSRSEVTEGADDAGGCALDVHYGHLQDTGGRFAVEVSVEDHDKFCGCDLESVDTPHFLSASASRFELVEITIDEYNSFCSYGLNDKSPGHFLLNGENDDDHDSAVGDLESDKEPEEDADKE